MMASRGGCGSAHRELRDPGARQNRFKALQPETHSLPGNVMWRITLYTALSMAFANFASVFVISKIVHWKFDRMNMAIQEHGIYHGILTLAIIVSTLATLCTCLVTFLVPGAGGSGAPENKGWLNGNAIPGLFTYRNLFGRATATILANTSGFPVGREGPTVTMGSNIAYVITQAIAMPHVQQWIDVEGDAACSTAMLVDEERFAHAGRMMCTVGGACGMAMLFDSPIGGIVYMFEEITSASWPVELTFRAFAGTTICTLVSRAALYFLGTNIKAFVVFEWNPEPQRYGWADMPFFILIAVILGPFSAFHTRACLACGSFRQKMMAKISGGHQKYAKMADTIFYAALCACTYAFVALLGGNCLKYERKEDNGPELEFVRFNCDPGHYNPVASLLLTTTDAAVKLLFSTRDQDDLQWPNVLMAFFAYTTLNICLTGIPVPSGNFTGSMLIGGMVGRIVGSLTREYTMTASRGGLEVSGVYAMVGSAAMLCGFKQMSVAVVIFICGCANDLNLVTPLMCSVAVSLFLNQLINKRGFDEEQIARKKIPFLPGELPHAMDSREAWQLVDNLPEDAVLPTKASIALIKRALEEKSMLDFPVVRPIEAGGCTCVGFTTRERLEAAVEAYESKIHEEDTLLPKTLLHRSNSLGDETDHMATLMSRAVGAEASGPVLPVHKLADCVPHLILERMTAPRFYGLFTQANLRIACVVSEHGQFRGMISRRGLIEATRVAEEGGSDGHVASKGHTQCPITREFSSASEERNYREEDSFLANPGIGAHPL